MTAEEKTCLFGAGKCPLVLARADVAQLPQAALFCIACAILRKQENKVYRCRKCRKEFSLAGRLSVEKRGVTPDINRIWTEKICCPYCDEVDIEVKS
jgi:DNA-directed RNA polymerase subunit RPC12/RpoP